MRYVLLAVAVFWTVVAVAFAKATPAFQSPWPTVTCADTPELLAAHALGVYHNLPGPNYGTVELRLSVCANLAALQQDKPFTEARYGSLFILAHELSHAAGYGHTDTPVNTDCHAWKILGSVARRVGIPVATVRDLVTFNRNAESWRC